MLNKGQVYSEELKMQLGEKFPAAIQIMAEAVSGGDTDKLFDMMDAGEVKALEALPEFARLLSEKARVGGALAESMKDSSAEQRRLSNVFNDMVKVFSKFGFEEGQAEIFKTMAAFFKEMKPLVQAFGQAWKYVGAMLRVPLGLLADLSTLIERLSLNLNMAKGDILALGSIATLLAIPFTRVMTLIAGALLLLEDFTGFLAGRDSLIGHLLGDDEDLTKSNLFGVFESMAEIFHTVIELAETLADLFGSDSNLSFATSLNNFLRETIRLLDDLNVMLGGKTKAERNYEARIESAGSLQQMNTLIKGRKDQEWFENNYGSNLYQQLLGKSGIKGLLQGDNSVFSREDSGDSFLMSLLFTDRTRAFSDGIMEIAEKAMNELTPQENAAKISQDASRRGFSPSPKLDPSSIIINFNGDNVDEAGATKGVTEALQGQLTQVRDNLGDSE